MEEFQGQERPVIILSTVRSSGDDLGSVTSNDLAFDVIQGLGFIQSEKRFNVAVTRAQSLLIVVGDPHLLATDSTWFEFLQRCCQIGAYKGCDLPLSLRSVC